MSISARGIVTPYIGGGGGFASISVLGYKDVNAPTGGVAVGRDNTETNFAWALYAGLAYKSAAGLDHRSLLSLHRSRRR